MLLRCHTQRVLDALSLDWTDLYPAPPLETEVPGQPGADRRLADLRRSDPTAYAVFQEIAAHALSGPRARPSQQRIADRLGLCRESVNRACARLRDASVITWTQEKAPGALWRHNVYELLATWTRPLHRALMKCSQRSRTRESNRRVHLSVIEPHGTGSPTVQVCDFRGAGPSTPRAGPP